MAIWMAIPVCFGNSALLKVLSFLQAHRVFLQIHQAFHRIRRSCPSASPTQLTNHSMLLLSKAEYDKNLLAKAADHYLGRWVTVLTVQRAQQSVVEPVVYAPTASFAASVSCRYHFCFIVWHENNTWLLFCGIKRCGEHLRWWIGTTRWHSHVKQYILAITVKNIRYVFQLHVDSQVGLDVAWTE